MFLEAWRRGAVGMADYVGIGAEREEKRCVVERGVPQGDIARLQR